MCQPCPYPIEPCWLPHPPQSTPQSHGCPAGQPCCCLPGAPPPEQAPPAISIAATQGQPWLRICFRNEPQICEWFPCWSSRWNPFLRKVAIMTWTCIPHLFTAWAEVLRTHTHIHLTRHLLQCRFCRTRFSVSSFKIPLNLKALVFSLSPKTWRAPFPIFSPTAGCWYH